MSTLKEIRTARGVIQKAVAAKLGIARQTYARLENTPWLMTIGQGRAVCKFLGIDPDEVDDFDDPTIVIGDNVDAGDGPSN